MNYIGFHVDKKDTEVLDESRFHAVRSSPVMNAIERCVDLADEQNMALLAPVIFNKMRRAAGLPTKVILVENTLTIGWLCKIDCVDGNEESTSISTICGSILEICHGLFNRSQRDRSKDICWNSGLSGSSCFTSCPCQIH